jgi:MFS family permease
MRKRLAALSDETFLSLRVRNFRLFFAGQFVSQVGNWLTLVAQALLVLKITHNNGIALGGLTACQFLPMLVLGAWTGLVADRSDKRRLLMIVQTGAMLQSFALAALAFTHHPPLLALYGIALAGGVATAFDNPTRRAFVVEMVPTENVQNAVSLNSAMMTSSRIFGPALAGLLIVTTGYGWCFTIDGISYLAVLYGLWRMNPAELTAAAPAKAAKGQVRAGLRYVRSVPDLFVPLMMMALVGTFAFNFNVVMPLFVKRTLHGSDTTFTVLYSIVSVGSLIGALATARRKATSIRDVAVGSLLFGASLIALAASPTLSTSFPAAVFMGFASIVFMTASTAIVQMRAAPEMRGRVLALQAIVFLGSTPIGGPLLGLVCQSFGARTGFLVGAVACLAAAGWGWSVVRRTQRSDASVSAAPTLTDVVT